MTYWSLNAIFLAVVVLIGVIAVIRSCRKAWRAVLLTLVILLAFTAVFDNLMISIGLVGYDRGKISGAFIGIAPLEDFAYAIAAAILLPSLWVLTEGRRR
jgi:lycopene cyclase domain-containing protein